MAENKTKQTIASVEKFISSVRDNNIRKDCLTLVKLMKDVTKEEPKMWGKSIVGFGNYHYKYASGREGDFFLTGFSPRKQNLTIYILSGFKNYEALMKKLGKHKTSVSCLYIKSLDDIDIKVLKKLVAESVRYMKRLYP
ncbi:MAG TPA: DUF1801 domain-containing protein [Ignavibacteriaceae bacterium]|jgi:hypothetical protein|nr:DUF1801 domain-containing protein [Ignavibacteriaceae bacterium]